MIFEGQLLGVDTAVDESAASPYQASPYTSFSKSSKITIPHMLSEINGLDFRR